MIAKGSCGPIVVCSLPALASFILGFLFLDIFHYLGILFLSIPLFSLYFFRDPKRKISEEIVSPADGKVLEVGERHITIFMSIMDVHVNRSPISGRVKSTKFYSGGHIPAYKEESDKNHRHRIKINTGSGVFNLWQITGIAARRIVPYIKKGDKLNKGDKVGIIRFGSRVRLEVPDSVRLIVDEGKRVKAGETKVGVWL